jgi:hypothetical protein
MKEFDRSGRKTVWSVLRAAFLIVFPTILACLVILEIGLRLSGRVPSNTSDGIFEQFHNSYRLKKNITKISRTPVYSCVIHVNELGFRDRSTGPRALGPAPYDLFLGESLTFGNGLDYDQTFVGLYARARMSQGTDVVNLAVGGHKLLDQEALFHDFSQAVAKMPSRVIICFSPLLIEGFDQPYADIVIKNGYIFQKDNWLIPYVRIVMGNTSAAYCLFRDDIRKIQTRVSNYNARVARELMDFYSKDNRLSDPAVSERLESSLARLDGLIKGVGAESVYVYLPLSTDFMLDDLVRQAGKNPGDFDVYFYLKLIGKHCRKSGIPLIDVSPALEELYRKGQILNFVRDAHYNAPASQVIADAIVQEMRAQRILQE